MSDPTRARITSGHKACLFLFDLLFGFMEHIDDTIRTDREVPSRLQMMTKDLLADLVGGEPVYWRFEEMDENQEPDEAYNRYEESKGWLDDNPNRCWSAPKDLHAACWVSHVVAGFLALQDALQEVEHACYPRNRSLPSWGNTKTRNTNWKNRKPGRPRKGGNKIKKPVGRPLGFWGRHKKLWGEDQLYRNHVRQHNRLRQRLWRAQNRR